MRHRVDLRCDAMCAETLCYSGNPCRHSLPWAQLQVWRSSNCGLSLAEHFYCLKSLRVQCFSLLDRHAKRESDCPLFGVKHLHSSSAQIAVARLPPISVLVYCCRSHSAVIGARSIGPSHPDSRSHFRLFLSWPALCCPFGCGGVVQHDGSDHGVFARCRPVHAFGCPGMRVLFPQRSAYRRPGTGILV